MTAQVLGMDTVAGLAVGDVLERGAQEILALAGRLDGSLHGFDWTGPDAERVRASWSTTERPSLDRAVAFVAALAALVREEARQQDDASSHAPGTAAGAAPAALVATDPRTARVDALTQRAQAAGLQGEALQRYHDRLAAMSPEQLARLDPAGFRGAAASQPDGTTCGSSSLVMSRMVNNPAYAMAVIDGYDPVTGQALAGSPQSRFAAEALAMHERTNGWRDRDGGLNPPWPMALGTDPYDAAREMSATGGSGVPGTDYDVDWVQREGAGSFDKVVTASQAGHTVPVYVGGDWAPSHVVLVTAAQGDVLTVYEPTSGDTYQVTREAWASGDTGVGGRPWAIVTPDD